ncbi:hypothetical protein Zm00014a_009714 [Zea mays]|uniref:Uncharacterized protein n=2 Tax=Zea mays TaxID=4577 RepID=A0A979HKP4_MAIZE|nr:uncharacterized protein LOC109940246 isoform X2 [Zea mays]XP_020395275.1 uncharacterized protein LOC100278010 isoform X1 [Zea mays]AQK89090.1 hypothetical protein ZEAMMB73_Zm00001d039226 [Zea mays]AQK89093.1 hypothetical protein ZEAMMB73_Zm00001d039230 [Zea mays]PWZ04410.1 hypothetical protein Zm00014a_012895 [Zea mays]PWZ18246.1 hypothetical protein Zm00014a_009714 [Zea mays]|eukprot:XP_020395272.1 uncharacterized protein LOC109940246 isoform X2 [Zea mays]
MTSSLSSGSSALASGLHGAPSSTTAQGGGQTAGEVSLLLGAADNVFKQEGETAYLASKRNIKQRLVAFYMYHPESPFEFPDKTSIASSKFCSIYEPKLKPIFLDSVLLPFHCNRVC